MTLTWHLVKKDLRRLRLPVIVLSLLTAGKLGFYATIAGLFHAPDLEWLNRLRIGPELFLRLLVEPLVAYFLVGWLVFDDSPVEKDAHWITRPISGAQLLAAKLVAAGLLFIALPLALNIPWWLACGFGGPEIAVSSLQLVMLYSMLVALGFACASLTDGFPRFVLWSLVGLGAFAMVQVIFLPSSTGTGTGFGIGLSRLVVWCVGGSVVALALATHQFVTRRHRKSLALAAAGILALGILGAAWRWNLTNAGAPKLAPESNQSQSGQVKFIGPASLKTMGLERYRTERHFIQLPVKITDFPRNALVTEINTTGEWSLREEKVWSSRASMSTRSLAPQAIRRILALKEAAPMEAEVSLALSFSPKIAQRAAQEPMVFHANIELSLFYGTIVAELPLREETVFSGGHTYTLSKLANGPYKMTRGSLVKGRPLSSAAPHNAVSLLLSERSVDGLIVNNFGRAQAVSAGERAHPSITYYALVNRTTGEFILSDRTQSGPMAITTLNQVEVASWQLVFYNSMPVRLDEFALVIIGFDGGELVKRTLDIAPMQLAESQPERHPSE